MKGAYFMLCLLLILPGELEALKCYACTSVLHSDCDSNYKAYMQNCTGTNQVCLKSRISSLLTRSCISSTGCVKGDLGGDLGTWCCTTDYCNSGTKVGSSLPLLLLPLSAILIGKHVF